MSSYINEEDKSLVLEFGKGDLGIAAGGMADRPTNELIIYPSKNHIIGALNLGDIGKSTAEVKALVRLIFNDPRSLDVLIHQAQELRALMSDTPKWEPEPQEQA